MARCQKMLSRYQKCNAHVIEAKDAETNEKVVLDFIPTSGGEYVSLEMGWCGKLTPEEKRQLERTDVLFFRAHDCGATTD